MKSLNTPSYSFFFFLYDISNTIYKIKEIIEMLNCVKFTFDYFYSSRENKLFELFINIVRNIF